RWPRGAQTLPRRRPLSFPGAGENHAHLTTPGISPDLIAAVSTRPRGGQVGFGADAADKGVAMSSRLRRSAFTPKINSTMPARIISTAPIAKATAVSHGTPLDTRLAKMMGPEMPPAAVPMA